jgi:ribonuclease H / adenosylcobalamin/alpha-ribazole phosphatase
MARKLVIEADGASRGNPGKAAYGALVLDAASGEVLAEVAEPIGVATNNVAEYRGLIAGLRVAASIDPGAEVEVRMDSNLVVQQMSGAWQIKHPAMRPLAAEAKTAFPGRVTYTWIPRAENSRADALGNLALDDPAAARAKTAEAALWAKSGGLASADAEAGSTHSRPGAASSAGPAASATTSAAKSSGTRASSPSAADDTAAELTGTPGAGWADPDIGKPTTVLLLRHGATALTAEKRFSGSGDPELAESGLAQAAGVAQRLGERGGVDAIVSSPALRTRQTAEAAAKALGLDVAIEVDFRETDFGLWDGYSFSEVKDRWPDELTAWLGSTAVAPPGGESFDAVAKRVRAAKERLLSAYPRQTVLLVSHVTPIKTLVRDAVGAPPKSLFSMELSAASISVVRYYSDGHSSLKLFNDTSHLPR